MPGCHYFSPVIVGLQEPDTTVLQLCPDGARSPAVAEGSNVTHDPGNAEGPLQR